MGKRLLVQRRGQGGSVFRAPTWRRLGAIGYGQIVPAAGSPKLVGRVIQFIHESGRGAPLVRVRFQDGTEHLLIAAEGCSVGQSLEFGVDAQPSAGNVLPLASIPEGASIYNVEINEGDGGRLVRSAGGYATLVSRTEDRAMIQFSSGTTKFLSPACRATIGVAAGGGRTEKPLLKAGSRYHLSLARSWKYPTVRGKAMNPYSHPHGGGTHPKGGIPVSRHAPPGAKVGIIASRRTGRTKR